MLDSARLAGVFGVVTGLCLAATFAALFSPTLFGLFPASTGRDAIIAAFIGTGALTGGGTFGFWIDAKAERRNKPRY